MKNIRVSYVIVCLVALIFIVSDSAVYARSRGNPPGPAGGPGASPRADRDNNPPGPAGGAGTNWENPPGPQGGPGASADLQPLPPSPPPASAVATTPAGGAAPVGGPAAVPDNLKEKAIADQGWEKLADTNHDGIVDEVEIRQWRNRKRDLDNNPPGPKGGAGTNWENPPGPAGGPGAGPEGGAVR